MATQKPNFKEPKWNSQSLTKSYNELINRGVLKRDNTQGLPFIISNMNQAKNIINDFYDNKINFTEQFLDKVSYTYKGNFRPFGRLFPDELRAFLGTSKGITYSDFVIQSARNLTPIRVEEIQQIGIDVKEPELEPDSVASSFEPAPVIQMTQDTTLPFKLFQEAFAEPMKLTVLPAEKISYWVTRPSGKIEQIKVTDSGKKTLESKGWVFSKDEPKPREIELLPEVIKILRMINYKNYIPDFNIKAIIPKWFENNIRWVESGQISQQEFINSYNELVSSGAIIEEQKGLPKQLPDESCQDYRSRVAQAGFHVDWINLCPEPQVNDVVNFPMVKQTAIDFQIDGSRITGTVILDKISANWNNYYDGRNLIAYFQSSDLADIVLVNKPNIVKFRPSEPPLLPTEKITINESTEGKDKIKVKLFLFTEDNVPVAEPLEFLLQEGEVITAKPKPKRTDFLGLIGSGLAGAIGISLLLSGVKK